MAKHKGFNDWVPVFAGGRRTDSKGRPHDGDALIDKALATFQPTTHEPPAVIGHPTDNAPAYGWVQAVKAEPVGGVNTLFAQFRDVEPTFAQMVKERRFPKRSASFYPDGRLRHVGFLGAMPPAVKGLPDMQFADAGEAITFEFGEPQQNRWAFSALGRLVRGLREWLIEKEGKEVADSVVPEYLIEEVADAALPPAPGVPEPTAFNEPQKGGTDMKDKIKGFLSFMGIDTSKIPDDALPEKMPQGLAVSDQAGASFSEADMNAAKKKAEADGKRAAEAEYAERQRKQEIASFCEGLVKDRKLPRSLVNNGMAEFMESLETAEAIEFGEEGEKEKKTPYAFFKDFVSGLAKMPIFSELATKETAAGSGSEFAEGGEVDADLTMKV